MTIKEQFNIEYDIAKLKLKVEHLEQKINLLNDTIHQLLTILSRAGNKTGKTIDDKPASILEVNLDQIKEKS